MQLYHVVNHSRPWISRLPDLIGVCLQVYAFIYKRRASRRMTLAGRFQESGESALVEPELTAPAYVCMYKVIVNFE